MLLENPVTGKKIFIKYHLATRLGPVHVYDYVDDLFDIDDVSCNHKRRFNHCFKR